MMFGRHINNRKKRRGFTLIECVVSIAIFAIMGTMFATFMVDSVRVVNLTIANEEDREFLLEAVSTYNGNSTHTSEFHEGQVTIATLDEATGKTIHLKFDLAYTDMDGTVQDIEVDKQKVYFDKGFLTFTTDNGVQYCIYLGDDKKVPTIDETLDPNQGVRAMPEGGAGGNG